MKLRRQIVCRLFVIQLLNESCLPIQTCQTEGPKTPVWEGSSGTKTAVLYPGGSASSPAIIGPNQRIANPFPGYFVLAMPEVFLNNIWGDPRVRGDQWYRGGVGATQIDSGQIIVRSLSHGVKSPPTYTENPFPEGDVTSAPWRLVVTRLGRIW